MAVRLHRRKVLVQEDRRRPRDDLDDGERARVVLSQGGGGRSEPEEVRCEGVECRCAAQAGGGPERDLGGRDRLHETDDATEE